MRWSFRGVALAVLLLGVAIIVIPERILPVVTTILDVSETPREVDYVLVLNGDWNARPFAAAALVKTGLAKGVLLTTQKSTIESGMIQDGLLPTEIEVAQRVLKARGIPDSAIQVLPAEISSTYDEAQALARFLDEHPEASIAVVTNNFHTRRARWVFHKVIGQRARQIIFLGVPRERVDDRVWWRTMEGCSLYVNECAKLAYYWLRY